MALPLRQSTASQEVPLGYFVDSTDGNTEETGLTIANTDIKIWKQGATTLANKNSGGGTHISNGIYYAVLDATDTNTLGGLKIFCHPSGALPVVVECVVLAANVYDAMVAGTDNLEVDVVAWNGTAVATPATAGYPAVTIKAGTGTGEVSLSSGTVTVGTNNDKTGYSLTATTGLGNQTANITGNLSGSVGSVTGAVGSVTGNVGGNVTGTVGGIAGTITTLDALDTAQDSQHSTTQSAIAALNDLDAAGVAGAVWNAATATYGTAGSYGLLVETNLDAAVSTAGGDDAATIWTYTTRVLTANTNLNDPTAAAIRAEIDSNSTQLAAIVADTNELQTDWANGGRLDLILDARASQTTADAIEADTQDIQSRIPAALVGGRIDATVDGTGMETGAIDAILTRQMTESYATDGTAPTLTQALMLIQQQLGDFAISGTTLTVKKVDGSTTAATFTLDDGTNPTSITRAT